MFRRSLSLLIVATLSATATQAQAGLFRSSGGCKPPGCGYYCKWVCCPTYEKEKVKKSGYEVECKQICVPRVRLPWQSCCERRCADVICVHRLTKDSRECGERCVIKWEAKQVCYPCGKPSYGYAHVNSCQPKPCATPHDYLAPTPVPDAPAPPAP